MVWIWSWRRVGHEMTRASVQTHYSLHHIIPFLLNILLVSLGNQVLLFKWFGSDCVLQVLPFQRRRFTGNSSIFLTNSCIKSLGGIPKFVLEPKLIMIYKRALTVQQLVNVMDLFAGHSLFEDTVSSLTKLWRFYS